jgi:hypothetical protein
LIAGDETHVGKDGTQCNFNRGDRQTYHF